jgi:hypothetical protein
MMIWPKMCLVLVPVQVDNIMDDFWIAEGSFSSLFMEILLVESRDFE